MFLSLYQTIKKQCCNTKRSSLFSPSSLYLISDHAVCLTGDCLSASLSTRHVFFMPSFSPTVLLFSIFGQFASLLSHLGPTAHEYLSLRSLLHLIFTHKLSQYKKKKTYVRKLCFYAPTAKKRHIFGASFILGCV